MSVERRQQNRRSIIQLPPDGLEKRHQLCAVCNGRGYQVMTIKHADGRISSDPEGCGACLGTGVQA